MSKSRIIKCLSPDRVDYVEPDMVQVVCSDESVEEQLRRAGFKRRLRAMGNLVKMVARYEDLADPFRLLRDLGLPFSDGGSGPTPGDVFRHLRENGLLCGSFRSIGMVKPIDRGGPSALWDIREDQ